MKKNTLRDIIEKIKSVPLETENAVFMKSVFPTPGEPMKKGKKSAGKMLYRLLSR